MTPSFSLLQRPSFELYKMGKCNIKGPYLNSYLYANTTGSFLYLDSLSVDCGLSCDALSLRFHQYSFHYISACYHINNIFDIA